HGIRSWRLARSSSSRLVADADALGQCAHDAAAAQIHRQEQSIVGPLRDSRAATEGNLKRQALGSQTQNQGIELQAIEDIVGVARYCGDSSDAIEPARESVSGDEQHGREVGAVYGFDRLPARVVSHPRFADERSWQGVS